MRDSLIYIMGQHTWFFKNKTHYSLQKEIDRKWTSFDDGEIYLDDLEQSQLFEKEKELNKLNNYSEYHNCFRTSKRNEDKTYIEDEIFSKKECNEWLEENKDTIYYIDKEDLDKFWEKYPEGVINFG